MEYIYAALLLHKLGKDITEDNVKAVVKAAGVEPDDAKIKVLTSALEGVNIEEAIEKGMQSMTVNTPSPVAAPAESKEIKSETKDDNKAEEKKEEESMAGLSALFG